MLLAIRSGETGGALAGVVSVSIVKTRSPVQTRSVVAYSHRRFAVRAVPSLRAHAFVVSAPGAVFTSAVVDFANVDLVLAVGAGVSRGAEARVGTVAGVEAGAVVAARFVVGAVVQVLIAEQSSPTLVADAIPWFHARTVHATRVSGTFVAQLTGPATVASKRENKDLLY